MPLPFVEVQLTAHLLADSAITALVGQQVYPEQLPKTVVLDTTRGAITYHSIDYPRDQTHDGPSGLASPRFQITCWTDGNPDRTPSGFGMCRTLAAAIRRSLDGLKHAWGIDASVQLMNEVPDFEPQSQTYMRHLDFYIQHQED